MKKILILFIVFTLTICLSGCGNSKEEKATPQEKQSNESQDIQSGFERIVPLTHEELMGVITPDSRLLLTINEEALGVVMQPFAGIIKKPGNLQLIDLTSDYVYTNLFYPVGTYGSLENIAKEYDGEIGLDVAGENAVKVPLEYGEMEISIAAEGAPEGLESVWFRISTNEEYYNSNLLSLVSDDIFPQALFDAIKSREVPIISTIHYTGLNEWSDENYIYFSSTLSQEDLQKISLELTDGFREAGYIDGTVEDEDKPVLIKSKGMYSDYNAFSYVLNEIVEDSKCSVQYYVEW